MIRSSNYRENYVLALSALIPAAQTATHEIDEAAAAHLGINRTDLRCLGVLLLKGSMSASKLAHEVQLTRGAMTTALDRLERANFVLRVDNEADRRGVMIEATQIAKDAVKLIWGPIRTSGLALLKTYSDNELKILARFFKEYGEMQEKHAARIRGLRKS
jgi:DNA-binding MarR family transcriptional regulator